MSGQTETTAPSAAPIAAPAKAEWRHMFEAPRDQAVRLHLPARRFKADGQGRPDPATVEHDVVVGIWDAALEHWVERDTREKVYPSGWLPVGAA